VRPLAQDLFPAHITSKHGVGKRRHLGTVLENDCDKEPPFAIDRAQALLCAQLAVGDVDEARMLQQGAQPKMADCCFGCFRQLSKALPVQAIEALLVEMEARQWQDASIVVPPKCPVQARAASPQLCRLRAQPTGHVNFEYDPNQIMARSANVHKDQTSD